MHSTDGEHVHRWAYTNQPLPPKQHLDPFIRFCSADRCALHPLTRRHLPFVFFVISCHENAVKSVPVRVILASAAYACLSGGHCELCAIDGEAKKLDD